MTEVVPEADLAAAVTSAPAVAGTRLSLGGWAWSLFEGGRDPYVILVTIYIFMPYFASVVVGGGVAGQAAVAAYGQYSGWVVCLTAPFLGASIDQAGPRKGWLALVVGLMIPLIAADLTRRTGFLNLAISSLNLAIGLGAMLSTAVAGWATDMFGAPAAFLGLALVGFAALAVLGFMMKETRPRPYTPTSAAVAA